MTAEIIATNFFPLLSLPLCVKSFAKASADAMKKAI